MASSVEASALAVSGRVDLATIALENAMANQRDAEAAVSVAMRNRDGESLAQCVARLESAQEGVRAAWQAGQAILKHADALADLAVRAQQEQVNCDLASSGESRANAAFAVAAIAADAEARSKTVESLTLELKKRWLLPLPSTGEVKPLSGGAAAP